MWREKVGEKELERGKREGVREWREREKLREWGVKRDRIGRDVGVREWE